MYNFILRTFTGLFILTFAILISDIASANLLNNFNGSKKKARVNQRRTINTATRSKCIPSVGDGEIELLVPDMSVAHHTSSANPSLNIFSRTEVPIKPVFTLIDPKSPQPLVEKQIEIDQPGIKKISLPSEVELKNNKVYLWNLAIPCLNTSKYYQIVLSAGIEKIKVSPQVTKELRQPISNLEKINIYNEHGLWYETIELVLQGLSEREINLLLVHNYLF